MFSVKVFYWENFSEKWANLSLGGVFDEIPRRRKRYTEWDMNNRRQRKYVAFACMFIMSVAAHIGCASTNVSARELADELAVETEWFTFGDGGCKFIGNGNEATILVGLSFAKINSDTISLPNKIEARGNDVLIPIELAEKLREQFAVSATRRTQFAVVIDPGHGGGDPGAVGGSGLKERDVVLDVSLTLRDMLQNEGFDVIMTRSSDIFISLDRRAQIANEAAADLFVSIHANAAENRSADGFEIFVPADSWENPSLGNVAQRARQAEGHGVLRTREVDVAGMSRPARVALMTTMLEDYRDRSFEAASEIRAGLRRHAGTNDRGTIEDRRGLRVLKFTYTPAVLVELDFLSNPNGERRLADRQFKRKLALGISEGIVNYFRKHGSAE